MSKLRYLHDDESTRSVDGPRVFIVLQDDGSGDSGPVRWEREYPPVLDCGHTCWSEPYIANDDYPEGVQRYTCCWRGCRRQAESIYGPWSQPSNEDGSEGTGSRTSYPRICGRGDVPWHPGNPGVRQREEGLPYEVHS